MPELSEVEVIRTEIANYFSKLDISDKYVSSIWLNNSFYKDDSELVKNNLVNTYLKGVFRRGKYLFLSFSNNNYLICHLRLNGFIRIDIVDKNIQNQHRDIMKIVFSSKRELRLIDARGFARVNFTQSKSLLQLPLWLNIGIDFLSPKVTPLFLFNLWKKRRISVKPCLLEQKYYSGLGNIYVNELLHLAKVRFSRPVNTISLSEIKRIVIFGKQVLIAGIKNNGTSVFSFRRTDNLQGRNQFFLNVYNRKGYLCNNCKLSRIQKIIFYSRSTYWCDNCAK